MVPASGAPSSLPMLPAQQGVPSSCHALPQPSPSSSIFLCTPAKPWAHLLDGGQQAVQHRLGLLLKHLPGWGGCGTGGGVRLGKDDPARTSRLGCVTVALM